MRKVVRVVKGNYCLQAPQISKKSSKKQGVRRKKGQAKHKENKLFKNPYHTLQMIQ